MKLSPFLMTYVEIVVIKTVINTKRGQLPFRAPKKKIVKVSFFYASIFLSHSNEASFIFLLPLPNNLLLHSNYTGMAINP